MKFASVIGVRNALLRTCKNAPGISFFGTLEAFLPLPLCVDSGEQAVC